MQAFVTELLTALELGPLYTCGNGSGKEGMWLFSHSRSVKGTPPGTYHFLDR